MTVTFVGTSVYRAWRTSPNAGIVASSSADAPQETENYKTKPPIPGPGGEADAMVHEKARQKRSLTEITERVADLAVVAESNNEPVPTSSSGNKLPDANVPGPTQDEILDCL